MDQAKTFSIGKLATTFGVSSESIRNWGHLLPPLKHTPGGHRRYAVEHIVALAKILNVPVPEMGKAEVHGD